MKRHLFLSGVLSVHCIFFSFPAEEQVVVIQTNDDEVSFPEKVTERSGFIQKKREQGYGLEEAPIQLPFCDKALLQTVEEYLGYTPAQAKIALKFADENKRVALIKVFHKLELENLLKIATNVFLEKVISADSPLTYFGDPNFPAKLGFSADLERTMVKMIPTPENLSFARSLLYEEIHSSGPSSLLISSPFGPFLVALNPAAGIGELWDLRSKKHQAWAFIPGTHCTNEGTSAAFIAEDILLMATDDSLVIYKPFLQSHRTIRLLDEEGSPLEGPISCFAVSEDSLHCAVSCNGDIGIVHLPTGRLRHVTSKADRKKGKVLALTFSKDGKCILQIRSNNTSLRIWDTLAGKQTEIECNEQPVRSFAAISGAFYFQDTKGHMHYVGANDSLSLAWERCLCFDREMKRVLSFSPDSNQTLISSELSVHSSDAKAYESKTVINLEDSDKILDAQYHPKVDGIIFAIVQCDIGFGVKICRQRGSAFYLERFLELPDEFKNECGRPRFFGITGDGTSLYIANDEDTGLRIRLLKYFDTSIDEYLTEKISLGQALAVQKILQLRKMMSEGEDSKESILAGVLLQRIYHSLDFNILGRGLSDLNEVDMLAFGKMEYAQENSALEFYFLLLLFPELMETEPNSHVTKDAAMLEHGKLISPRGRLVTKKGIELLGQAAVEKSNELLGQAAASEVGWVAAAANLRLGEISYNEAEYDKAYNYFMLAQQQNAHMSVWMQASYRLAQMHFKGLIPGQEPRTCERCQTKLIFDGANRPNRPILKCPTLVCYFERVPPRDLAKAWEYFELVAQTREGYDRITQALAQRWLAERYFWDSEGYEQDSEKAEKLFTAVAQQEYSLEAQAEARLRLAIRAFHGFSDEIELLKVLVELEALATQKDSLVARAEAQRWLGQIYCIGCYNIVKRDCVKARRYLNKAAKQTNCLRSQAEAYALLGEIFLKGDGVRYDEKKAYSYCMKAYSQDESELAKVAGAYGLIQIFEQQHNSQWADQIFVDIYELMKQYPSYAAKILHWKAMQEIKAGAERQRIIALFNVVKKYLSEKVVPLYMLDTEIKGIHEDEQEFLAHDIDDE